MSLLKYTNNIMSHVNNSPIIAGTAMLFLNIGSRYIDLGLSKTQENAIKGSIAREALIFSIVFVATKNIVLSIIMTFVFFVLTEYIFNEKSKFCAAPNFFQQIKADIDLNGDNIISDYEVEKAIAVLKQAKGQKKQTSHTSIKDERWAEF